MAAAVELFLERGYDGTTVADIADRAGLTERTFFRHYGDKREVLFAGPVDVHDVLGSGVRATSAAHRDAPPLTLVAGALDAVCAVLQGDRDRSRRRQQVIDAHDVLRERELIKLAAMADTIAQALREQGVPEPAASLAAEAGLAAFKVGWEQWMTDDTADPEDTEARDLTDHVRDCLAGLVGLVGLAGLAGPSGDTGSTGGRPLQQTPANENTSRREGHPA